MSDPRPIGVFVVGAEVEQLVPLPLASGRELGKLRLGERPELMVVAAAHLLELGDLALEGDECPVSPRQLRERAVLAGHGGEPLRRGQHLRVDERAFEFLEPGEPGFELVAHGSGPEGEPHEAAASAFLPFLRLA